MKAVQQKIKLQQLFNCYSQERLYRYSRCPDVLAREMKDMRTIVEFAECQFTPIVVDLRKKSLEYEKSFRSNDNASKKTLPLLQQRKTSSNHHFSYSIHCLNPQSIVPQFPERRLLTELKLKFLESESVDEGDWQKWFCPQENILKIKTSDDDFEIKLGISLGQTQSALLFWQIFDVTCNERHHPQLCYFLVEYVGWFRSNEKDCQSKLIKRLQLILNNISPVLLLLAMREEIALKGGEIEKETIRFNFTKAAKFVWKFDLFENFEKPKLTFYINDEQSFKLYFNSGFYIGEIFLTSQSGNSIFKIHKSIQLRDRNFLYQFSLKIHSYRQIISKFESQYEMLNSSFSLFLKINGIVWRSEKGGIEEEEVERMSSDGVWGQIIAEGTVIFKIQQDLSLSYPDFEKGFFGYLLSKLSLADLVSHISLRHQITKINKEFQFKIYRVNFLALDKEIIYEFRSYRYSENHPKLFKAMKAEEDSNTPSIDSNDNFIIILKIAPNFSWVRFFAYKVAEGEQHQKEITDNFLPKKWKDYRDKAKQRFQWRRIFECIAYLCKCYLVQRSYNRRMTQDQRKMTVYSFK